MNPNFSPKLGPVEGAYLNDILGQPDALEGTLAGLGKLTADAVLASGGGASRFKRVVLTGMGSSYFAAYPLHRRLSALGQASFWIETAELLLGFDDYYSKDTLLVAVSQSGESAETVRLLERAQAFGQIIAVTNHPASRLAAGADARLLLHAGAESTVSCKTYLATLAVLHWLGAALAGARTADALAELAQAREAVRLYLARWREHVAYLTDTLRGVESLFVTGRGDSLATAGTGGLILKESTRHHAEGMSCAAFRHGPLELVGPHVFVLAMAGDERVAPLHRRLVADVVQAGGRAAIAAHHDATAEAFRLPAVPAGLLPIVEMLPVQMISLALAALDGREAGRFGHATKITAIE